MSLKTTNGKRGGNFEGKPHYNKKGKAVGGIKAIVTDNNNEPVEIEGGEVIINKEASKKHWRELSKINQSAGNGVPIGPPVDPHESDVDEYKKGGKILFNPNKIPNKWILKYGENIKKNHSDIWDLGGNIFGNEAFNNLKQVAERGYWLDSEKWMMIKWRSYVARHKKDFRIAGVVAMLKWVDKVDKGWPYMKQLIESEIQKRKNKKKLSGKMSSGGHTKAQNKKFATVMSEFEDGKLRSGSKTGPKVTNPKQAVAIAYSESKHYAKGGEIPIDWNTIKKPQVKHDEFNPERYYVQYYLDEQYSDGTQQRNHLRTKYFNDYDKAIKFAKKKILGEIRYHDNGWKNLMYIKVSGGMMQVILGNDRWNDEKFSKWLKEQENYDKGGEVSADSEIIVKAILSKKPRYKVYFNAETRHVNIGGFGYTGPSLSRAFDLKMDWVKIKNAFNRASKNPDVTKREVEKLSNGQIKVNKDYYLEYDYAKEKYDTGGKMETGGNVTEAGDSYKVGDEGRWNGNKVLRLVILRITDSSVYFKDITTLGMEREVRKKKVDFNKLFVPENKMLPSKSKRKIAKQSVKKPAKKLVSLKKTADAIKKLRNELTELLFNKQWVSDYRKKAGVLPATFIKKGQRFVFTKLSLSIHELSFTIQNVEDNAIYNFSENFDFAIHLLHSLKTNTSSKWYVDQLSFKLFKSISYEELQDELNKTLKNKTFIAIDVSKTAGSVFVVDATYQFRNFKLIRPTSGEPDFHYEVWRPDTGQSSTTDISTFDARFILTELARGKYIKLPAYDGEKTRKSLFELISSTANKKLVSKSTPAQKGTQNKTQDLATRFNKLVENKTFYCSFNPYSNSASSLMNKLEVGGRYVFQAEVNRFALRIGKSGETTLQLKIRHETTRIVEGEVRMSFEQMQTLANQISSRVDIGINDVLFRITDRDNKTLLLELKRALYLTHWTCTDKGDKGTFVKGLSIGEKFEVTDLAIKKSSNKGESLDITLQNEDNKQIWTFIVSMRDALYNILNEINLNDTWHVESFEFTKSDKVSTTATSTKRKTQKSSTPKAKPRKPFPTLEKSKFDSKLNYKELFIKSLPKDAIFESEVDITNNISRMYFSMFEKKISTKKKVKKKTQ